MLTYPLLSWSLAVLGGIVAGAVLPWGAPAWAGAALAALGLAWWGSRRRAGWRWLAVLVWAAALGAWRWQAAQPALHDPAHVAAYADAPAKATLVGVLTEMPDVRDTSAHLRVRAVRLRFGEGRSLAVHGDVLVQVKPEDALRLRYGDRVVVTGFLKTPPEGTTFAYREYLARQGIFVWLKAQRVGVLARGEGNPLMAAIYAFRTRAHALVKRLWPAPEHALLAGILLGLDKGIPAEIYDAFRKTGTAHIIAISGFNITILAGLFLSLFGRWWGKGKGALMAAAAIGLYTVLVGADAAVVRAAVMGMLGMAARQLGRRQHAYTTLAFTAALMALWQPAVLWDVGFQLSFAATWGLLRFAQPMQEAAERLLRRWMKPARARRVAAPVGEFFLFTLAAQLATLPISAYHFHQISLISFIANPAILPVQAPLMVGAGAALLLALVWPPLGQPVAALVWPLAAYTIRTVEAFARWPVTTWAVAHFGLGGVVAYYAALLGGAALWQHREALAERLPRPRRTALALPVLTVLVVIMWRAALARPDGYLHVTLLNVGNGAGVLVRSPTGRVVLLGGGSRGAALAEGLGRFLPAGAPVDWWVVGSPRQEVTQGLLTVLASYPPERVLWAGRASVSSAGRTLRAQLEDRGIALVEAQAGQTLALGQGAQIEVLATSPRGGVFLLTWQHFRLLLPLGADFDALAKVQQESDHLAPLSGLLLAEGGYAPLNPPETVAALRPRVLLLSVQPADPSGLPDLTLLQALRGFPLLRTDRCGWIDLTTDGKRMWVTTQVACAGEN